MKQVFIYDYALNQKDVINTDVEITTYDSTVPQLTTFNVLKNTNIETSDIVLIRDEKTFIGIVERVGGVNLTEVAIYPIEHKFDNDLDIDTLDGNVVDYLEEQITKNFIETDDVYMKTPFVFENTLTDTYNYTTIVDSGNLLDIVNEIYLNTGVYMDFEPVYTNGKFSAIKIKFKNVANEKIKRIRYDNPQIVGNVDIQMSNTSSNKVTIYVGADKEIGFKGNPYKIYLREDNELTTNPADEHRIKKVINKNIEFTADEEVETDDEYASAIVALAKKELKGDIFGYKIEFTIIRNKNSPWSYRQACVFVAEDKTFNSLVTRIEYLSEKHAKITLGAFRTKLHEKIMKLAKPQAVLGSTIGGVSLSNGLGQYLYWFEQDDEGNLYICSDVYTTEQLNSMFELENDNLYVNYGENQEQVLSINDKGELQGVY